MTSRTSRSGSAIRRDGQAQAHGGHAADDEHEHRDLGDDLQGLGEHD